MPSSFIRLSFSEVYDDNISSHQWKQDILMPLIRFFEKGLLGVIKPRRFQVYKLEFPSAVFLVPEALPPNFRYYRAFAGDSAVIVLPQRGGGYSFARLISICLASQGISAYEFFPVLGQRRLPFPVYANREEWLTLERFRDGIKQTVVELQDLIPKIPEKRLGILGLSLGVIYASLISGIEPRISSSAFVVGGGSLADLIWYSTDKFTKILRTRAEARGWTREDLEDFFRVVEPISGISSLVGPKVIMVNALEDKDIPRICVESLGQAWQVNSHYFKGSHWSLAIRTKQVLKLVLRHFQTTLRD